MSKLIDLTSKRFGRLVVLEKAPPTGGQAEWICKCDCGNIKKIKGGHLRNGVIQSGGCFNKERISSSRTVDLLGQKFGKLSVISYQGSKNGRAVWLCRCDCGNEVEVLSSYLKTGDTKSCGCVMSYREVIIEQYLKDNAIPYQKQYTFPQLRGKKYPLRFDFAIFNTDGSLKCLIEYQGEQHYKNVFKLPVESYKDVLLRDKKKRQFCSKNGIPLYELNKENTIIDSLKEILQ